MHFIKLITLPLQVKHLRIVVYFKHVIKLDYSRMIQLFVDVVFSESVPEKERCARNVQTVHMILDRSLLRQ